MIAKCSTQGIVEIPISQVTAWDKNPRGITTKDFNRLKKHLTKYGQYKPLICFRENGRYVSLGGNMRLKAMQDMGIAEVKVLEVHPKNEKEKIELSLIDNDRAGYYEDQQLAELIYPFKDELDLADLKVDLRVPDIDLGNVLDRYAPSNEKDDEVPEVKETDIRLGDMFQLGRHRLLCGDATKREDVERLMDKQSMILMSTDPPYGIWLDHTWCDKVGINRKGKGQPDQLRGDNGIYDWTPAFVLSDCHIAYVWHGALHGDTVQNQLKNADYQVRQQIIWVKDQAPLSRSAYHWKHETCWYAVKSGQNAHWRGGRKQTTVWVAPSPKHINGHSQDDGKFDHPTQKPLELSEIAICNHLAVDEYCYDPFLGSGTTLIACEKHNRICYGMEIDPHYCQVIIDRWQNYTGQKAVKIG